jgi:hypothetical protein
MVTTTWVNGNYHLSKWFHKLSGICNAALNIVEFVIQQLVRCRERSASWWTAQRDGIKILSCHIQKCLK